MKLLIVESPAKAKTIGKYLGSSYKVLSSYGHVRGIPSETGAVQTENDFVVKYQIVSKSPKNINDIISAAKFCDEIYMATDPDREGEAISWHIVELLKEKKAIKSTTKLQRVVFHEITPKAIKSAIANPRDINMDLVHAQQARQTLDYLVGFTISPLLWRKLPGSRSAGRVQSVALRMICEREAEIEIFKSIEYWSIIGIFSGNEKSNDQKSSQNFIANLNIFNNKRLDKFDIKNEEQASSMMSEIKKYEYHVSKIDKREIKKSPKPPFTTSTLLQEASRKLGFSTRRTSQIAQKLYEGISIDGELTGLITYMRTDSTIISTDVAHDINRFIKNTYGEEYAPNSIRLYKNKSKNAQEAHEAIRPTDIKCIPEKIQAWLDTDQYRLYTLIWKRAIASQMENAILESTLINIGNQKKTIIFGANGSVIKFLGFYKVYGLGESTKLNRDSNDKNLDGKNSVNINGENEEIDDDIGKGKNNVNNKEEQLLPALSLNQNLDMISSKINQHFTQPPPRYNEASFVKKMEELGIGRPSTYPTIISILVDREYVAMESRRFIASERGRLVNSFLMNFFTQYVEYDFTAKMEDELDNISHGKETYLQLLENFWKTFKKKAEDTGELQTAVVLDAIENTMFKYIYGVEKSDDQGQNEKIKECPTCNKGLLVIKNSKYGPFIGCNKYPECNYTRHLNINTALSTSLMKENSEWPKHLGKDTKDGSEISVNSGPYGFYVMKKFITKESVEGSVESSADDVENDAKVVKNLKNAKGKGVRGAAKTKAGKKKKNDKKDRKMISIPKSMDPHEVTMEYAKNLLNLPIVIGQHPDDGGDIKASIGMFGPYVEHNKVYASVKKENDIFSITLDEALALLEAKKKRGNTRRWTPRRKADKH